MIDWRSGHSETLAMITRRNVVIRFRDGIAALLTGYFGIPRIAAARAQPEAHSVRENCSFLIDVRTTLARRVNAGDVSLSAETSVRCPLCRETIVVTAEEAVAYLASDTLLAS